MPLMKLFITILSSFHCVFLFGQFSQIRNTIRTDSCNGYKVEKGSSRVLQNPLYLANGIVTNSSEVDIDMVIDTKILQCPESSRKYSYIASGGAVLINTTQPFKTTTPKAIRDTKIISGKVLYAINGWLLLDTTLSISLKAIYEIEVYGPINYRGEKVSCLNIWTISKEYRKE
jgi:hypothetical protein